MKKIAVKKEQIFSESETAYQRRPNERGSALVMVLLVSSLLLVASVGLLLEASLNSANVTDAVSEQQAYQAAESGIQTAINALRRNVAPNPLIGGTSASDPQNRINFRKAVTPSISNKDEQGSKDDEKARLSRWLNYNYTPPNKNLPRRVVLANGTGATSYDPNSGYAFSVTLIDPDDTDKTLDFSTTGKINDITGPYIYPSDTSSNRVEFSYVSRSIARLDVSNGAKPQTDVGSFKVSVIGSGATLPDVPIPFAIKINMTEPFYAQRVIRGFIMKGGLPITATSTGGMKLRFDSDTYELMGSEIVLSGLTKPSTSDFYQEKPIVDFTAGTSTTTINATMTQTEPLRLMLRSVGYGPRGSQKILEAFIRKNLFDGLPAPATLTLVGDTTNFNFNSGNSQNVKYSGIDFVNSKVVIPPIGTTDPAPANINLKKVIYDLENKGSKTDVFGTPANVSEELPAWLKDPTSLEKTIVALEELAAASGRVFTNGQTPTTFGDFSTATGITFVKGDVDFQGSGGGILVCTGTLAFKGNFAFSGLIIVIGQNGVIRKGGGGSNPDTETGTIQGNVVVAPYNRNNLGASFLSPRYDMSGGGKSDIVYNSSSTSNGQEALSNLVLGIAEK